MSVADQNKSANQRNSLINNVVTKVFESNQATVIIKAKDGITPIANPLTQTNKVPAGFYVQWLSTVSDLVQLIELDVEKNNAGKIRKITVNEVYQIQ
jgi:hypothetical protein